MPPKTTKKSTKPVTVVTPKAPASSAVKKPPTKRATKKVVDPVVAPVVGDEVVEENGADGQSVVVETTKRRGPNRESIFESFGSLIELIDLEIARLRESPTKSKGIKFLRSINKRVKTLHSHSGRVMKQRKPSTRNHNLNSGFLKPVKVSTEMCKFTGWDQAELRSRVDVTKYICKYISDNDLQNPADKRQIVADSKLSGLLGYDASKVEEPLTYYRLQTYLKHHFLKDVVAV